MGSRSRKLVQLATMQNVVDSNVNDSSSIQAEEVDDSNINAMIPEGKT